MRRGLLQVAVCVAGACAPGCGGPAALGSPDSGVGVDAFVAGDGGHDAGSDAGPGDAGPPPAGDTCATAIDASTGITGSDGVLRVAVTTNGSHDELTTCDIPGTVEVGEVVVRYVAPARGRLTVRLETRGSPSLFAYDIRTDCLSDPSSLSCHGCGVTCGATLDDVAVGADVFVVVTQILSAPMGSGEADVTFALEPFALAGQSCGPSAPGPRCEPGLACQEDGIGATPICGTASCGDGFVGFALLDCDDGGTASGDGCDASCVVDAQGDGGASCATAVAVQLPLARVGSTQLGRVGLAMGASIAAGSDDAVASCASGAGPEAAYTFTLAVRSHVSLDAMGADVLSIHEGSASCGTEHACTTAGAPTGLTTAADLDPGSYVVLLDRTVPSVTTDATYGLSLTVTPL